MDLATLTRLFADLGAPDPAGWAASQHEEGINQLGRWMFLKGAWDNIVGDGDTAWISQVIDRTPHDASRPYDGVAHSLRRLVNAGADPADISEVVRGMQAQLLFAIGYQLDDPGAVEGNEADDGELLVDWQLIDVRGGVSSPIGGLHESVLETDPAGREVRPRQ